MRFCKDCGTVLNLFGNNERELCSSCVQHQKKLAPASPPETIPPASSLNIQSLDLLGDALFSYENNKIVLRSKEGWELWSGTPDTGTDLNTIVARARRIYEIRLRRQKN